MTVLLFPPPTPSNPIPVSILFFWEVLRAPNHSTLFTFFPPIHSLYLPQCFALDYVSFTLSSLSQYPLNRSGEGGWGEVGGGAEVEEE